MSEFIYGRRPVYEALRAGRRSFSKLFILSSISLNSVENIFTLASQKGITIVKTSRCDLDRLVRNGNHQGIIAETSSYPYANMEQILDRDLGYNSHSLVIICDHVKDPQNLGTVLRVADSVGAVGVVIPKDRAVAVTPAVVRASAGAAEYMNVVKVTNIGRTIVMLKSKDFLVIGLDSNSTAISYESMTFTNSIAVVIGEEGSGLSRLTREKCNYLLHIPMYGKVNSMNVATALAVVVHEIRRQWRINNNHSHNE